MSSARYTTEFKAEAVKQVIERGHGVVEVAKRLCTGLIITFLDIGASMLSWNASSST